MNELTREREDEWHLYAGSIRKARRRWRSAYTSGIRVRPRLPDTLHGATEKQLESTEAFTGRFARAVDLLVNKVLRSLDRVELKAEGTLLDVVNRAEKRGFVADAGALREMKDVRNMIAHDYAGAKAAEIFAYCRAQKPAFDEICTRVEAYVRRLSE